MKEQLHNILQEARVALQQVTDERVLEELRVKYLGKKGLIKEFLGKLGSLSVEQRKKLGAVANEVRDEVERLFLEAESRLKALQREEKLKQGVVDISLPLKMFPVGYPHPLTLVTQKMVSIFQSMGYTVVDGPELEKEQYNFDMLNIPKHHPARDDHDSFYVIEGWLMRTHTSPVQIRTMLAKKPPIAVVVPGRCYRRDAVDATHSHTFHQMEGLVVGEGISFADLKGTLLLWAKLMFGEQTQIRLRPDYFPFTEPSAELAVTCPVCHGPGCAVCKHTGWVELMGCGMVEPTVLKNCGIDPVKYSGFAFGLGIERVAMTVYGVKDIRHFYENDIRLLEQFMA